MFTAVNGAQGATTLTSVKGGSYSFQTWMTHLHTANSLEGTFYLFDTPAHFYSWAQTNLTNVGYPTLSQISGGVAFTYYPSGVGPGLYTVVFTTAPDGTALKNITNITAHETGHYMDWLFGEKAGETNSIVSNSTYYLQELDVDWTNLNVAHPCLTSGANGAFSNKADSTGLLKSNNYKPYYICNGSDGKTGYNSNGGGTALNDDYKGFSTNQDIVTDAWPEIYKKGAQSATQPWKELFAETAGAGNQNSGFNDFANSPDEADWYLGYDGAITDNGFACTRAFIKYLVQHNSLPLESNPPSGWPVGCPLFSSN